MKLIKPKSKPFKSVGLILCLLLSFSADAQSVKIKWKQINKGLPGQVAIVGVDSLGHWVTPPFLNIADTSAMLANVWALIATKANDNTVVHLSGTETITGVKNFSASPTVPTPTTASQAAPKSYVDALGATVAATYVPLSFMGANNGVATLNANGKIPNGQIPAIAISETFVVNSQAAMLALSAAEQGDVAVRTDQSKSYILTNNTPGTLSSWQELLSPTIANTDQVPEGIVNLYFTTARARQSISAGSGISYNSATGVITNSAPDQPSNLALGTVTTTTQPITNSNGTGVTLPSVTTTSAGLMSAADKTKLDGIAAGAQPGTVTSVVAGNGMNFTTISTSGAVHMGTPSSVTLSSTNSASGTTHSHAFIPGGTATQYITGAGTLATFPTQANLTDVAQQFTGSTSLSITLSQAPSTQAHLTVYMNGVALHASDFTVSGTTLTLANLTREATDYFLVYYSY